MPTPARSGSPVVTVVLLGIAALDLATGLWLLASDTPWTAHGPGTLWDAASALADGPLLWSLYHRLGAFSVQAALATALAAALGHRDLRVQGAVLGTWTLAGLAFAWTDGTYFGGTAYHALKQAIGVAWVAGLAAWAWRWKHPPTPA